MTVVPYDGDVTITCAPAATPTLEPGVAPVTPAPTTRGRDLGDDDSEGTRMPVAGPSPSTAPVESAGQDTGGDSNTGVIAGSVAGGVALLAIAGVVAYKLKKPPPPPPSYDDLIGSA